MPYSSSIQVVNDANGTAYAFLADNGQVWQCQWNPQAGQWEKARVVPGASGGVKLAALFHPVLWGEGDGPSPYGDFNSTQPGIVLAYRVGSGKAAEVFTSLGQWNGAGKLIWSEPLQLTNDQADDQAFALLGGGVGTFSLVSQKQTADVSPGSRVAARVTPTDSDLYRTDLQIQIHDTETTLNNISGGTARSVGSVTFTVPPSPTAAAPGAATGNSQLSRQELIMAPAPQGRPLAAMALTSSSDSDTTPVSWQPGDAFQPSSQPQSISAGVNLGQNLLRWQLMYEKEGPFLKSDNKHEDADPSKDERETEQADSHDNLSESLNQPGSAAADDHDNEKLSRTDSESSGESAHHVEAVESKPSSLDFIWKGSFGLTSSGSSGTTVASSASLSIGKGDAGKNADLLKELRKRHEEKMPGWIAINSKATTAFGGEINTKYQYKLDGSPELLNVTTTESVGADFSHTRLSISEEEGSSYVVDTDVNLGFLWKQDVVGQKGGPLPEWLSILGLVGGSLADLEKLAYGGSSLLETKLADVQKRTALGLGSLWGRAGQANGSDTDKRLNLANTIAGTLLAAGGPAVVLATKGATGNGPLAGATLKTGVAAQESVAITLRYLFRSIAGIDLSVTDTNFTSWNNSASSDGSSRTWLDQNTFKFSAGLALPLGISVPLFNFSHAWSSSGGTSTETPPPSTPDTPYFNADQQANYPLQYIPQSGSVTLASPSDSSGAYTSNPLLTNSTAPLQLFQLGTTTAGDGAISVADPGSNLADGSYSVAILGTTVPGQQTGSGATATFTVVNGAIEASTFAISAAGTYLSLPETSPGSNTYALVLDLSSQGIAPPPSPDSFQSPWATLPLITVSAPSTSGGATAGSSPLTITPVQQVSTVVVPTEAAQSGSAGVWSPMQGVASQTMAALATDGSTVYMAVRGEGSAASAIWWTSSKDGGNTWAQWQDLPAGMTTAQAPSLAVVNGTLFLSYLSPDSQALNLTSLSDAETNTWAPSHQINQESATSASLITETAEGTEQLAVYYVAKDESGRILKAYCANPSTSLTETLSGFLQTSFTTTPVQGVSSKTTLAVVSGTFGGSYIGGSYQSQASIQLSDDTWLLAFNDGYYTKVVEIEVDLDVSTSQLQAKAISAGYWSSSSLETNAVIASNWQSTVVNSQSVATSATQAGYGISDLQVRLQTNSGSTWTSGIAILSDSGSGQLTASGPLAVSQYNGQTYLAYQGGTTANPDEDIHLATASNPNSGSGWSVAAVASPGQSTGVGLTSDSRGLILSYGDKAAADKLQLSRITPQAGTPAAIQSTTSQALPSTLSTAITILKPGAAGSDTLVMAGINTEAGGYTLQSNVLDTGNDHYPPYDATTQLTTPPSSSSNQAYTYANVPVQLFAGDAAGQSLRVPLLNPGTASGTPPDSVLATVVLSGGMIRAVELQEPLLFAAADPATTYSLRLDLPAAVAASQPAIAAAPTFVVTPQTQGLGNLVADDQFSAQASGGSAGVYVAAGMADDLPLDSSQAAWPIQSRVTYVSEEGSGTGATSTVVYLNGIQTDSTNGVTAVGALSSADLSLQNMHNNGYQFTLASHPTAIQLAGTGSDAGDTFVAWVEAGNPVIPVADASDGATSFQELMQQLYGNQRINFRLYDSQSNTWQAPSLEDLYSAGDAEAGGSARPAVINHLQAFNVPDGAAGLRTMLVWSETSIQAIQGSVEDGFSTAGDNTTIPTVIKAGWLNPQAASLSWEALLSDANGHSTVQTIPWDAQTSVGLSITDLAIASAPLLQGDGTLAPSPLITWSQAVRTPYTQSVLADRPRLYLQFSELQSGLSDINIGTVDSAYTSTSASATGLNFTIAGALPAYQGAAVQNIDGTGVLNTGLGTAFSALKQIINNIPEDRFTGVNQPIAEVTGFFTPSSTDASSAILTVTAVSAGTLSVGDVLSGAGIAAGTTITVQGPADANGFSTYSVNQPQSLTTPVTLQAIPAPAELPLIGVEGSISGTTLSVSSVGVGGLQVGDLILGEGVAPGTIITAVGAVDAAGVGSYNINTSQTVATSALVATPNIPTAPYTLEFWAQLPAGSNPDGAGLVALGQPSALAVGPATVPSGWQLNASFQVEQITYQQALEGGLISSSDATGHQASDLYGWGWSVRATGADTSDRENGGGSNLYNNALQLSNLYSGVSLSGVDAFLSNYNLVAGDLPGIGGALANTVATVTTTELAFTNALEDGQPTASLNGIGVDTATAVMNEGLVLAADAAGDSDLNTLFTTLWAYQQLTGQAKVNFSLPVGSGAATTRPDALNGETYAGYPLDFTLSPGVAVSVNGSGQLVFDVSDSVSIVSDGTGQSDWRDGQWHYIVASYLPDYQTYTASDGTRVQLPTHRGTAQLSVDNQRVGSSSTLTGAYLPINSSDSALLLANNNGGALDQLAVYDKALTGLTPSTPTGEWPQPTAADALRLLRNLGYSIDNETPNPGAIVGGVTQHWAVRHVNPNDAVQATFSSSYDASSGSWTTACPLNPSLAVDPTTPSESNGGPVQDPLIINLSTGNTASFSLNTPWCLNGIYTRPANQTLSQITFSVNGGARIALTPDQILVGVQSLASLQPQSSADNLNYVIPSNDPDFTVLIPRGSLPSTPAEQLNATINIQINTTDTADTDSDSSSTTQVWTYIPASLGSNPAVLQAELAPVLKADNAAIATAPLVAQAPLQLKYIDSGISLSSASDAQAAHSPALTSPATSFGQSQVIGGFTSSGGMRNGWLAIAQPFSTNATSNPAGRVWIQYTGQSSNGNPSSDPAQAPSNWLNALASSNFSPDNPNLPLLHASSHASSVGGLLIQADPSDGWGQNFGETMLVADLDGDGNQELIIAAPQANGGGQVVIIAGSWIAANLTTAGASSTLNLSDLSGLGSAVTVLTPASLASTSTDDISVAGFGSALAVDTSTTLPTLWIGAPNYLRQLDGSNTTAPLASLQPIGAIYSWQSGEAPSLTTAAVGYGGTVTTPAPSGSLVSGTSTTYWGSQLGAAIATDGTGKIAISAPGVTASLLYSGTDAVQQSAAGRTNATGSDGEGALVKIQLPSAERPDVSTTEGILNPGLQAVAGTDSTLASEAGTAMQNLKALQVNTIAQATEENNQAIQVAPVGAVYLFNQSADVSSGSQIDAQSTAAASHQGATFYGPNPWNTLGATGFGSSLSFGDFINTNANSVLAIGAPQTGGSGAAYLVDTSQSFSSPGSSGWLADLNLGSNQYLAHLASGLTLYGAESADNFGNGLLNLGDTNQDGYHDLLVQAFNASQGAGNGYVLFGSDQLIQDGPNSSQPNPASGSMAPGSIGRLNLADGGSFNTAILSELGGGLSGYTGQGSFGAGDANGDGLNDIPLGSGTNGKAYLTWGHPYLESINSLQLNRLTSDTGYLLDGLATTTRNSLQSIGDFNGDGYDDFLSIQPSGSATDGFTSVRLELGAGTQEILADYSNNFYSFLVNSGTQVWGAGDVNGDGYSDIALAPGNGQTWGAGITSGLLYGRSSGDLPIGSSFGLVAPVDAASAPQTALPSSSPGGSTDAAPAVVAVGHALYSVVKAIGGTDLYFNQSLDGGLTWSNWTNLSTDNAGFSTNSAPTLAWFNDKLYLGFLNDASFYLSSWDPDASTGQWSAPTAVAQSPLNPSAFNSSYTPTLLASNNALQLIWVDPDSGELLTSTTTTPDQLGGSLAFASSQAVSTSQNPNSLARSGDTLYMATSDPMINGTWQESAIAWSSSSDGGKTWDSWQQLPSEMQSDDAPSVAVVNGTLYLAYIDSSGAINITSLIDAASNQWSEAYRFPGQSSGSVSLIAEPSGTGEQLAIYYVTQDANHYIHKGISGDPQSSQGWQYDIAVKDSNGTSQSASWIYAVNGNNTANPAPLSLTSYNGETYIGYFDQEESGTPGQADYSITKKFYIATDATRQPVEPLGAASDDLASISLTSNSSSLIASFSEYTGSSLHLNTYAQTNGSLDLQTSIAQPGSTPGFTSILEAGHEGNLVVSTFGTSANGLFNNSNTTTLLQSTSSWTSPEVMQVSVPDSTGSTLTPITATGAPSAAWLGSTPVLATQGVPLPVQQTLNGFVPSQAESYAPANANITQASLTVLGGTWEAPGYTGPAQVQRVIKSEGNNWLLAVNDGDDTGVIEIEAYFDPNTGTIVTQAVRAGYWASASLEADSLITEQWSQPNAVTSVAVTSDSGHAGFGIVDLQVSLLPSNPVINVYAGTESETIFSIASQFTDPSSSGLASAPSLTSTPTGLALTHVNADGSVSLNRLDVLAANGVPLDGVQVNSNGVVDTTNANLQWQSTLLNASHGNLPAQLASVPVSVDEALLLMNINASGTSTANQVWINAVPPGKNPDSLLWQNNLWSWSQTSGGSSQNTPAMAISGNTIYMAVRGNASGDQPMYWTSSPDGGNTWAQWQQCPSGMTTEQAPSLAVVNGTLYLSYLSPTSNALNITSLSDASTNTWASSYQIPGQSASQASLIGETIDGTEQLAVYYIANDASSRLLKAYTSTPQTTDSWSSEIEILFGNGYGHQTASAPLAATTYNGQTYLAFLGGTTASPSTEIYVSTASELNNGSSWTATAVANPGHSTGVGLSSDTGGLVLSYVNSSQANTLQLARLAPQANATPAIQATTTLSLPASLSSNITLLNTASTGGLDLLFAGIETPTAGYGVQTSRLVSAPTLLWPSTNFGDLNGDGRVDQFSSTGNNAIYTIPGLNYQVWDIRPAGDVNGNGHDDVLLALEPTGPAYVQTTPGQPSALQTVLLDGTLFQVDASNSFSLARAGGSASSGWTSAGLKAPLNPWSNAELYDLASTTSADHTPLLQNWINPILAFEAGALTAATAEAGQIPQYTDSGSQYDAASIATPSAAVSPDGTIYILHTGDDSNGGLYLCYQETTNWNWIDIELSNTSASGRYRSPSAAFYEDKLYVAYADKDGNISVAYSATPTVASSWTSYTVSESTSASPTLLAEQGRLAMYFPSNDASDSLRATYSLAPETETWGGVAPAKPGDNYTGASEILNITYTADGVSQTASTTWQIAATLFQGRPVLAFGQAVTGEAQSSLILATPIAGSAATGSTWIAQATSVPGGPVGLTTDQAMLYLSSTQLSGPSGSEKPYGVMSNAVPASAPGTWVISAPQTLGSVEVYSDNATTLTPFLLNKQVLGVWTDNNTHVNVADIDVTIAAPAQPSLAGYSIDGNVDTNGDGFADLLISDPSDPSKGVDNQYVLFGGDDLDLASQVGTPGDDVMQGTALADVIDSLAGSDLVVSLGGADVILTGAGNDQISITGNGFHRIDAGAGFDELLLQGSANQSYDFQLAINQPQYFFGTKLKNIELISSLDYGANTLRFDAAAVNASNPDRILFVTPDSSDAIVLSAGFQRDSRFDTSFQGSLWSAFAVLAPGAPTTANPALVYVLNPGGASADSWLSTHVTITGAATPMLMAMRAFAVEDAPLPMALAGPRGAAGRTEAAHTEVAHTEAADSEEVTTDTPLRSEEVSAAGSATPTTTTADVVSSTPFGDGLCIDALRTNPQAGVARFRIRRRDSSRDQLLAYSSTSANGSTEPGRDTSPVFGLLRLEAGVSSRLITVPLVPGAIASHRDPSVSLRVEEIRDDGQREAHLLLQPDPDASGARPVLSALALAVDPQGRTASLSLRADTSSDALNALHLSISLRSSADTQTLTATRRLALADTDPSVISPLPSDGTGPLPLDHDGLANHQVTARFALNLDPDASGPLVTLLGPEPHGSDDVALVGATQVRFRQDAPLTAWRSDAGTGAVTFSLTAGTRSLTLIRDAEAGSRGSLSPANALQNDPLNGWLATESKPIGSRATLRGDALRDLAWTPSARRDGVPLPLQQLQVDANQVTAHFSDGVSLVLWQATGSTPAPGPAPAVVEVQRLARYDNSLGFYPVDSLTGTVDGLNPGEAGYLQRALARAEAAGLLLEAGQLPAYGQSARLGSLPLDSRETYGMLLLQKGDRSRVWSSFAAANPDGAPQMIRLGDDQSGLVIGMEDISVASGLSDSDYNDLIVSIHNATIPLF